MLDDYCTVNEAADLLGFTPQYVRKLLRNKQLTGTKIGTSWTISWDALHAYKGKHELVDSDIGDHKRRALKQPSYNVLSFFSGAMGLDLGLEQAGMKVMLASEIDKATRLTIETNRPDLALIGDIRDYSASDIKDAAGLTEQDDIDVMVGGPPCQAFSSAGKRQGFNDERGNVFLTYIDRILALRPKFAVIENVRGLLSSALKHRPIKYRGDDFPSLGPDESKGAALYHILTRLRQAGYGVSFNLYNAANYGVPQKRERVILVCSRDGGEKHEY